MIMNTAVRISEEAADTAKSLFPGKSQKYALEECVLRFSRLVRLLGGEPTVLTAYQSAVAAAAVSRIPTPMRGSAPVFREALAGESPCAAAAILGETDALTDVQLFIFQEKTQW